MKSASTVTVYRHFRKRCLLQNEAKWKAKTVQSTSIAFSTISNITIDWNNNAFPHIQKNSVLNITETTLKRAKIQ